jgi:hypothetical protein
MIQLRPGDRFMAEDYLAEHTGSVFPASFEYLYKLFSKLLAPEFAQPDDKIKLLQEQEMDVLLHTLPRYVCADVCIMCVRM